jgi:serine/threonine protein kinase
LRDLRVNEAQKDFETILDAGEAVTVSPSSTKHGQSGEAEDGRDFDHYLGNTLDQKYRLETLLGKGGMGAVYLSRHLGTERNVAVKLIKPEFMRTGELVERFKREARAAGRLRHPNIVDVTDFGIASLEGEQIAYLVMEYLDGCTLGEIMAEERQLPLAWVVGVIEQICAAVQAAHERGIVHRDLKPANIWLEPNSLGGYRVKVLDFGVAKLADEAEPQNGAISIPSTAGTALEASANRDRDGAGDGLTQAGAILGTPAYMSPEQCRGEGADRRSDIYSIGIITYEMLSGKTPFHGQGSSILRAHQEMQPRTLREIGAKVPKAVSRLIMSTLEKDPGKRPASAKAFAQTLQGSASGLAVLYRRAFALYSEYFPQILKLSLLAHLPVFVVSGTVLIFTYAGFLPVKGHPLALELAGGFLKNAATFLTGSTISGLIAIMVIRLTAAPLRPVSVASVFRVLHRSWRPFFSTGLMTTIAILVGFVLLLAPGVILMVRYALWAPVVLMEGLKNRAAMRRSRELGGRSWQTTNAAVLFEVLVPWLVSSGIRRLVLIGTADNRPFAAQLVTELSTLSSVFILPLLSILVALVFLKLRQLGGQDVGELMKQVDERSAVRDWEKRMIAATKASV